MAKVTITSNLRDLERDLSDFGRKILPRAARRAINATAEDVKAAADKRLDALDRPTPFTRKAWAIRFASTRNLLARVFAKDRQAAYLKYAETGGTRSPQGRALVVPVGRKVNRYGNLPRNAISRDLAGPKVFAAKRSGSLHGGIYRRVGRGKSRGLKLLVSFESKATYRDRPLRFRETAELIARARIGPALTKALAEFGRR